MEDGNTPEKQSETEPKYISIRSFIEKISKKLSINNKIHVIGKILNCSEEEENEDLYEKKTIYFAFNIFNNTEINPFTSDVLLDIELNQNKTPYAHIRNDFIIPSLNDNRNYFYCLTKEHDYIYNPKDLVKLEKLLIEITNSGIENFLFCLKENLEVNNFIYYGEYELNSIYNMNDFLENNKLIKFYRVNEVVHNGENLDERYIVVTQLYFLILRPLKKDKSFAQLIFLRKLRNIFFRYKKSLSKKLNKKTFILYIQDVMSSDERIYNIEFMFIDRSRPPVINLDDDIEEDELKKNDINNKNINTNDSNTITKSEEADVCDKYDKFGQEIEKKQIEINFNKFNLVLGYYKPLFNRKSDGSKVKLKGLDLKNRIIDYEKMFQHCEKIYHYYYNLHDIKKYKKRMDFYFTNINYLCVDLVSFYNSETINLQFYLDKIKYYCSLNEKNF